MDAFTFKRDSLEVGYGTCLLVRVFYEGKAFAVVQITCKSVRDIKVVNWQNVANFKEVRARLMSDWQACDSEGNGMTLPEMLDNAFSINRSFSYKFRRELFKFVAASLEVNLPSHD